MLMETSESLRVKARPPETGYSSQRRRVLTTCSAQSRAPLTTWERCAHLRPQPATVHPPGSAETPSRAPAGGCGSRASAAPGGRVVPGSYAKDAVGAQFALNEAPTRGQMTQAPGVEMGTIQTPPPASST